MQLTIKRTWGCYTRVFPNELNACSSAVVAGSGVGGGFDRVLGWRRNYRVLLKRGIPEVNNVSPSSSKSALQQEHMPVVASALPAFTVT